MFDVSKSAPSIINIGLQKHKKKKGLSEDSPPIPS